MMKPEEPVIEAEVVEIDGVAVEPRPEVEPTNGQQSRRVDWQSWQGKIRVLDKRWMPLWIVLGVIAFILLVTVGLLIAVLGFMFWMVKAILRAVFSIFSGSDHTLNRRS
ncbi:MAG: hypothetical protein V4727_08675 [Verrucomicrobiota bacterium]